MKVYVFEKGNYYIGDDLSSKHKKNAKIIEVDEIPKGKKIKINKKKEIEFISEEGEDDVV